MFVWFYHSLLISDLNTCPILMYDHANRSLGPALQECEGILPLGAYAYKSQKCAENRQLAIFGHVFAIFRCLIGPLVAKFLQILVEEIISFDLHGHTSKSDKY